MKLPSRLTALCTLLIAIGGSGGCSCSPDSSAATDAAPNHLDDGGPEDGGAVDHRDAGERADAALLPVDAAAPSDTGSAADAIAADAIAADARSAPDAGPNPDAEIPAPDSGGGLDAQPADVDPGPCVDTCVHGTTSPSGQVCSLWQPTTATWEPLTDGPGFLENRARHYTSWLRRNMEPAGGVMSAFYADNTLSTVTQYGNTRDSAIWTGTYLAAESLRYLSDGHPEALQHVQDEVRVLHRWFTISGDPGYLVRYAAPANSAAPIQQIFDASDPENHRDWPFDGTTWHWKGSTSRDQYQGPLLGYSLAYQAATDEATRALIRSDVVTLVEQLMRPQRHAVRIVITGLGANPLTLASINLDFQYAVFAPSETTSSGPEIQIDINHLGDPTIGGFQEFYPDLRDLLSQVSVLSWLPSIPRASSAIMLTSFFLVALQMTENVPSYAARRAAIQAFYEANVGDWLGVAERWSYDINCGAKYYGVHIAFEPAYNVARLEHDPARRERFRQNVLRAQMWDAGVSGHKNVFFAYVYAANPPSGQDVTQTISEHSDQLRQFPPAPLVPLGKDWSATLPADPSCPGLSATAIDVGQRAVTDYMWQRGPWDLREDADPSHTLTGVDYLLAYWLGRFHGFNAKDAVLQCLRWR